MIISVKKNKSEISKTGIYFSVWVLLFLFSTGGVAAQDNAEILPLKNKNNINVIAKGKPIKYFTLSPAEGTWFAVDGPGRLIGFCRVRLKSGANPDSVYSIKYKIDDKLVRVKKLRKVNVDPNASYEDKTIKLLPSKVKDFTIQIPPDKHIIEIFSTNPDVIIDAHFKYKEGKKPKWEHVEPSNKPPTEKLKALNEDKIQEYYRVNNSSVIKVKVKGPTTIQAFVRGEFQCDVYGSDEIKIEAFRNDTLLKTYRFSCKRSNALVYEKNKDLVPGGLDKIFMEVPKGDNNFKFVMKSVNKSALMRFSYDKNMTEK